MRIGNSLNPGILLAAGTMLGGILAWGIASTTARAAAAPEVAVCWIDFVKDAAGPVVTLFSVFVAYLALREQRKQVLLPLYLSDLSKMTSEIAELDQAFDKLAYARHAANSPIGLIANRQFIIPYFRISSNDGVDIRGWARDNFPTIPDDIRRRIVFTAGEIFHIPDYIDGLERVEDRDRFLINIIKTINGAHDAVFGRLELMRERKARLQAYIDRAKPYEFAD